MTALVITDFDGLRPRTSEELLPPKVAQVAQNCDLRAGEIRPIRQTVLDWTPTKPGTIQSIHRFAKAYWFHWSADVDVIRGPIAGDTTERTYWTGDGAPKVTDSTIATSGGGTDYPNNAYTLGIPAPTTAPVVALPTSSAVETGAISLITFTRSDGAVYYIPVITSTAHGLAVGDVIEFSSVGGTVELNGNRYTVGGVPTVNTFTLRDVEQLPLTAYTSGGTWKRYYADINSTTYVYTYVTGWLEEGPPSPASIILDVPNGHTVDISGMETGPAGSYNIIAKNIYRTNTSSIGTDFQFVKQVPLATTSTTENIRREALGDPLETIGWEPPPNDLKGLIILPNGVAAGFVGNTLYMSPHNNPHAYPVRYQQPTSFPIVGLGHFSTTIVICTEGVPAIASGYDPESTALEETEDPQACVSKRSIVSMNVGVAYASPDGLIVINASEAKLATRDYMTKEEWQSRYKPDSIHAYVHDGRYIAFYDTGTVQAGFIFDPLNPNKGLVDIDLYATAGYEDLETDTLYLQVGADIVKWDAHATNYLTYDWKSTEHRTEKPVSFSCGKVKGEYPLTLKVYADGSLMHTEAVSSKAAFRLPPNLSDSWHVEVTGAKNCKKIILAESFNQLKTIT